MGESFAVPPHKTVQASCQRKLDVSCCECGGSDCDTARLHALRRALPECGQVGDWSESDRRSPSRAIDGWERVDLSSRLL
jgi:hypothetical protein